MSSYFESHRQTYYAKLQAVREEGDISGWLHFFFDAVTSQANDAIFRSRALVAIREEYRTQALETRSNLPKLVELITRNPMVTVRTVEDATELTNQAARNLIKAAQARGWLESRGRIGRGGKELWVAPRILEVMEMPMSYE